MVVQTGWLVYVVSMYHNSASSPFLTAEPQ